MEKSEAKRLLREALDKSTCFKHPLGCVVETEDLRYVLGYNGKSERCEKHLFCDRKGYKSGEAMHLCPSVHSERRALYIAARDGIRLNGGKIYLNEWFPCADCAKGIIESGLVEIVTPDEVYSDKSRRILIQRLQNQGHNFEMAEKLLFEAGINIVVDESIRVQ